MCFECFETFDQLPLNVSTLGGFDGCVYEAFSSSDGVKEIIVRRETIHKRVFDHTSRLWIGVIGRKGCECSAGDVAWNALPFNILLPKTSHDL